MDSQRNTRAMQLAVSRYLHEMKRYKWFTAGAFLFPGVGTTLIFYVPPLIIAKIVGRFAGSGAMTWSELLPYILIFVTVWTLGEICWRVGLYFDIKAVSKSMQNMYIDALDELSKKDIKFFHNNFVGSLTKKVVGYARRYEDFFDNFVFNIVPNIFPLPFIGYVLWQFSPWLIIVLLGMLIVTALVVTPLIRQRRKIVTEREAASNVAAGHVADVISNIDTVKAYAHEDHEHTLHVNYVTDLIVKTKKSWDYQNNRVDVATSPLYILTNALGLIIALAVSKNSTLSLEAVFITFSYYASVTRVMWDFNRIYRNLESALSDAAQFTELLLDEPKLIDVKNPKKFILKNGEVEFKKVGFRYSDGSSKHLFSNLNIRIRKGEKIALVGHSGGGKTTITKLLLRFMDIDEGEILIDGQNISEVRQHDLRSNIAYVPQEPLMFHRTLAENIRYGKLDAGDAEVYTAAKQAHAEEFIFKLREGYETLVGERGVKLSGGQRQRIAIARAMLKNAPILVLDEATSALDSESEVLIQDALWKLMEGRTAIVIAHRLSTIQKMDRILVLEDGKIVEEGSHKELISQKGTYAQLWAHQSGGFLED